ncbi:MAG: Formamidopyrimidine-DNA glycosylase [Candidatus Roizmanbacteria bacterium GW2011_GWA2_33_33]|uniref:Formamidopyrimidine-DNA glycosylase n=2 Tax=Candidatus Roizmaniibacteriota TaxID=1752723 RepID=A0A0G0E769_9BACT|nr:MAG: Formamidopyrimidine-DNA glycosylase [Candidatus Roizmanbacteria bacterium GW2011_GWA2_33_33]KKP63212.1 MAG: Formamidopyrimidine-DNA glycosylase [Candidatus Roizmanbacteria bacterium GW2011_GWC2_34_23]
MPELPEVETIKRLLKPNLVGKIISDVKILSPKNFVGNKQEVIGKKINSVDRYGKVLVIKLFNNKYLNIHFKLSGQILFSKNVDKAVFKNIIPFTGGNKMPANTTRVIIEFTDGSGIFFNDLRKFGWMKISDQPLKPKGIDVLSKEFTPKLIFSITQKTRRPIKVLLMDQDLITGIGNIYANDSLFLAKIHPQRLSNSLTEKEIKLLYKTIKQTINEGIKDLGSSGADEAFILPDGSRGGHQRNFLVYQREDEPCLNCKTIIKRIKHNGRSSFFCPLCQK